MLVLNRFARLENSSPPGIDLAPSAGEPTEAVAVPGDESVGAPGKAWKGADDGDERPPAGKQPQEWRSDRPARGHAAVGRHQVPGRHLRLRIQTGQKPIGLRALKGDRPEPTASIPGEDLVDRPAAEPAVGVVEEDVRAQRGAPVSTGSAAGRRRPKRVRATRSRARSTHALAVSGGRKAMYATNTA